MSEENEQITPPVTEEVQSTETPEVPTSEVAQSTPTATTIDWLSELEKADPKTLRSHPKIAGMIGSEIQRARQEEQRRISYEAEIKAAREAEENMLKLAQEDPVSFAEKYLSEREQAQIRSQLDTVRGQTRSEFAKSVGNAFNELPEWSELNAKDHEELARALMGKTEDEVIPIFTHKALDLMLEKRAQKKHEQWKEKEQQKDREALRQEEAAKLLKISEAPEVTPPKAVPAKTDLWNMTDEQFREYATKKGLRV